MTIKWITQAQVKAAAEKGERAALAMSLRHWKQLAAAGEKELRWAEQEGLTGCGFCALCERYDHDCTGCPLVDRGRPCFEYGPYSAADGAFADWRDDPSPARFIEWRIAARAMRDLLQRLYDEGKK